MKKLLSLIVALVFTVTMALGCAGPGTIKSEDPKSLSVLLEKLDKCQAEKDGFVCLSIPPKDKNIEEGKAIVYLTVYRMENESGFGMYSLNGFILWIYDSNDKTWILILNGSTMGSQTEEQIAKNWALWVKLLNEKYNLEGAFCDFAPSVHPI